MDGHEIDVRITKSSAKNISSDTTEAIDANLHRHCRSPPKSNDFRLDCGTSAVAIVGQILPIYCCKLLVSMKRKIMRHVSKCQAGCQAGLFIQLFETAFPHAT